MATMLDPYTPAEQQQGTQQGGGGFASIPGLDSHLSDDPLLAGQQMKQASYGAELQRQQLEAQRGQQALQLGQLESERAQRAARLENQAQAVQTAGSDIAQWAHDPTYRGQSWNDVSTAHPEVYAHAVQAYPDIIHQIPGLWNEAQRTETGNPELGYPQPPTGTPKNVSIGPHGVSESYSQIQGENGDQPLAPLPENEFPSKQVKTADDSNPYLAQYRQAAEDASDSNPINKLPPTDKIQAQLIASYRMPAQSIQALIKRFPLNYGRIIQAVNEVNPNFDEKQYQARQKALSSFAAGRDADNVMSMNRVIGHLGDWIDAANSLNNFGPTKEGDTAIVGTQQANWLKNLVATSEGRGAPVKFKDSADAVGTELAKVFKGTGTADVRGIKEWRDNLSPNMSPEQIQASKEVLLGLLGGQISALRDKYQNALGDGPQRPFLNAKSQAILRKNGLENPESSGANEAQPKSAQTQQPPNSMSQGAAAIGQPQIPTITTQQERDALPSGSPYIYKGVRATKP